MVDKMDAVEVRPVHNRDVLMANFFNALADYNLVRKAELEEPDLSKVKWESVVDKIRLQEFLDKK